jgi:hypothetical protein
MSLSLETAYPRLDDSFRWKGNLTGRNQGTAWETINGFMKLIYLSPDEVSPEEASDEVLRGAAWLGLGMRLRVRA